MSEGKLIHIEEARAQMVNQQELIRIQGLLSSNLSRLNTLSQRIISSSPNTIVVRQDPHYEREWQDGMAAVGDVLRPFSKQSAKEGKQNIQALEGLGILIDLLD